MIVSELLYKQVINWLCICGSVRSDAVLTEFHYPSAMTDAGYSSEYEVYLTHRNGVQIVTNELSLHLLDEMRARSISPSETAAIMHLPKSTIHVNSKLA